MGKPEAPQSILNTCCLERFVRGRVSREEFSSVPAYPSKKPAPGWPPPRGRNATATLPSRFHSAARRSRFFSLPLWEADRFGHAGIGIAHLLLGLLVDWNLSPALS
jgi:hypothetical protein